MDRRSSRRFPVRFPLCLTGDGLTSSGTVVNLSIWGCTVQSATQVRKGARVAVQLLPLGATSSLRVDLARVRWAGSKRFGVEFLNMPAQSRAELRQLLLSISVRKEAS